VDNGIDLLIVVFLVTVCVDDDIIHISRTKDIQSIAKYCIDLALEVCRGASEAKGAY
jgi:hypothetical protein